MILQKLKKIFLKQVNNTVGNDLPEFTQKLNECYAEIDSANRWQGDIYPKEGFNQAKLPNLNIPFWMLVNRTCHLYEEGDREVKIPFLNFIVVTPLLDFLKNKKSSKTFNAISELINNKLEYHLFLPANSNAGLNEHMVANFNLIYSFSVSDCPKASEKKVQLSSPYCEHVFQRFARFYYTVGYDDGYFKSKEFRKAVADEYDQKLK